MNREQFKRFIESAPSQVEASHRITQRLIETLLEAPEEVQLKQISEAAAVANPTLWARVVKAGIKRCGTTTGIRGHCIHLYRRADLLKMLGVESSSGV